MSEHSAASEKRGKPGVKDSGFAFVLAVFTLSRLFFLGAGAAAAALLPWAEPVGDLLESPGFLDYWAHWDGAWYLEIATQSYVLPEDTLL